MKNRLLLPLLLLAALATSCGGSPEEPGSEPRPEPGPVPHEEPVVIPPRGTDSTLDLGTWNLEWFGSTSNGPSNESLQLSNVRAVIAGSDLDIWGVAEVVDATHFQQLVSQLPGYAGLLASDSSVTDGGSYYSTSEQKVGLLYKTDIASVVSARLILTSSDSDFAGRPPLEVLLRVSLNGHTEDLVVIVLHAKAFNDEAAWL
ncbi:MAG TPA: endonuclease/exonuclease/phosphatase family protein, partial [Myxococcaceae bacterium]|nr:endonuclease/exonuclease/phosphatase family protein [Myxococcaceae bacterium]